MSIERGWSSFPTPSNIITQWTQPERNNWSWAVTVKWVMTQFKHKWLSNQQTSMLQNHISIWSESCQKNMRAVYSCDCSQKLNPIKLISNIDLFKRVVMFSKYKPHYLPLLIPLLTNQNRNKDSLWISCLSIHKGT